MATKKTSNFLPTIFQTDVNNKFLSATMDQLVTEPNLRNIYGYIGRTFAPTYKSKDSYVIESSAERQKYQLEPSIVVRDEHNEITFFASYVDVLNKIEYYSGLTAHHNRLFDGEYYSFDPQISFDKFVNFSQYYWLKDGPSLVDVNTNGVDLEKTFTVTRNANTSRYDFTTGGAVKNTITLARGGSYTFNVDQIGTGFWIQTEPGVDGLVNATPTVSTRDVLGVINNGAEAGSITFNVPQASAQDRYVLMNTVANVEYALPIAYEYIQNQTVSQFVARFPQYAGLTGQLNGKTIIFVDQDLLTNYGEAAWTMPDVIDPTTGLVIEGYDAGTIIPDAQRFGIWTVQFSDVDTAEPLIRLVHTQDVPLNEKVYIKSGLVNANKEFFKDYDGFFHRVPVLSSIQDTLYFQDGSDPAIYGTIKLVDIAGWEIDIEVDILGKTTYTSPNGIIFTSGLKIKFGTDVTPTAYQNKEYYVEGVGASSGIRLVDVTLLVTPELYNDELALNYPDGLPGNTANADYITINRASIDLNAWSRNNRWFHRDVIKAAADYNGIIDTYDQTLRAQRPIVQFEADLQLFNEGRIGKAPITILDTTTVDAFNELHGQLLASDTITFGTDAPSRIIDGVRVLDRAQYVYYDGVNVGDTSTVRIIGDAAFGTPLTDGMRVIFANDIDPLVRNKIYVLNLVQTHVDSEGLPSGPIYINLNLAEDSSIEIYDTVVVTSGKYKGTQWWYDGATWTESQQKTSLQQDPLFDVRDLADTSFSLYPRSTFAGTKLFGYNRTSTGKTDPVLYFPLKYRSFQTQGDIEFANYFDTDTFSYVIDQTLHTDNVATGFLQQIADRYTLVPKNNWATVVEDLNQYQLITYIYDGLNSPFKIDVSIMPAASIPHVKIYKNNTFLKTTQWAIVADTLVLTTAPTIGDKIDILVYSNEVSKLGQYQVPLNLDLNAQNIDLASLTLGQIRNHLIELSQNTSELIGDVLSQSNLRDIEVKSQGGNILQHAAPIPHVALFLLNDSTNFIDATRYAQQEYARFKNKFLELSATLSGIQPTDPVASVDLILTEINKIKNKSFPWYYSDMVPYNTLRNTVSYTIFDPLVRSYEITNVFDAYTLSNQAVLVYLNDVQLIVDTDYTFDTDRPAVTFTDAVTLAVDDIVKFVEYSDTNGCYIPETPTKLGLFPKFIPEIFLDDTYRYVDTVTEIQGINVVRGHDGSIMPTFGDYRDDFVLELEKRIYNNIKLLDVGSYQDIYEINPGKFRTSDYSLADATQLLSKSFLNWIGNNKIDFTVNDTFNSNDPFTWNYSRFVDRIDGESLPGSWRACYQYYYDTIRPHMTPWEMLGFTAMPTWWEEQYGPAPYTGGNKLLWDDLEAGMVRGGIRAGIDPNFARPGLSTVIPVDVNGLLLSPAQFMTANFNSTRAATAWSVGQYGPVEWAWRNSSDFPFAAQQALALAKPARYFGLLMDNSRYMKNYALNQYLTSTNDHIKQTSLTFNGDVSSGTLVRTAGYINWIADFLVNQGINPSTVITPMLKNYQVNLAYKMAGFSDQKYLQVLAEQSSPSSTNDSIIIPNENYNVHLYKSTPVEKITYSGVIVEKTNGGYSVRGYNLANPYFTIIPSIVNSNAYKIKVLGSAVSVFKDYQNLKLTVPYGYEFNSQQQLADFLISYERHLMAQGFTFNDTDEQLGETRNWKLSVKEFLFWAQQGWKEGSILVLSPVANILNAITVGAITDGITDSQYGSKVLDQNFNLVKNVNYNVLRSPTAFKLSLTNDAVIGYAELNLVQYEHVLVFDNTTVFNDIIYKPELGNRQFRLKLIGQKTADWDGSLSAPGFMYNSGVIAEWTGNKDYLKGDLVQYKNQYYVALQNVVASVEFAFAYWKQIAANELKKGLLPNFATIATKSQVYYDSYTNFKDSDQIKYSHGLIGFKPRQYLADLGLSDTTQIEFYKGFIKQKGSANAVNQLTSAEFNNLSSAINYYEEWAIRVGEYGALDTNPYIEIALDEKAFSVNPAIAEFVAGARSNEGNGVTVFNKSQLYKSTEQFDSTIAINRDAHSDYTNDIPGAGYVNIDDVDTTIFDLANFKDLDNKLSIMGSGYTIWCARDFSQQWNVYRITETDNHMVLVSNSLDGYITFTTDKPHNLIDGAVFMTRNFNAAFDGFYQVDTVVDLNNVLVKYSGDTSKLDKISGRGIFFALDSLRFAFMEDSRKYLPPHGWKVGEKIWIDRDAATTVAQGQLYATPTDTWKVYEKTHPWNLKQSLIKGQTEYAANDGYGTSLRISADGLIAATGTPFAATTGTVSTFAKGHTGEFTQQFTIAPDATNTLEFGHSVDFATNLLAVGAPASNGGTGYVYVYSNPVATTAFNRAQVIVGNIVSGDRFGTSIAYDEHGTWLYVGAPGNDTVYVYGLNKFVSYQQTITSVNDQTILTLSGNITATAGAVITQTSSDASVTLLESVTNSATLKVSSLTNIIVGNVSATILVDGVDTTKYASATSSLSITNTLDTGFTPDVTDDANSLLITRSNKTYIPNIDYTVSGTTVTFAANIVQGDISIVQQPYYTFVTSVQGTIGSNFGSALDASWDGAQLGVGAPLTTVNGLVNAGSVYVYDRVIEAFNSTGTSDYVTDGTIGAVHRVTIDNVETTDYFVVGTDTIRFITPPAVGQVIFVEINQFNLLEVLTGDTPTAGAHFGTALTICSNNCAIYVGAPYYTSDDVYNTGAVYKFHNRGRLYGTNLGYIQNPTFTPGDTIRLDNFTVEATGTTLDSLVNDINNAGVLGVSAANENGYLRLNSDKTVAKNRLRILSGQPSGATGVFADSGLKVFAEMQIIVNPYHTPGEYFGSKVILASNAYMLVISSERGTTRNYTTLDGDTTTFDNSSTSLFDVILGSGSVYIYELYDDPRDNFERPGRYAFCQQLNPGDLTVGDKFGSAIDVVGPYIVVSAPSDDTTLTDAGSVYLFENPNHTRGWNLIKYQQPTVDIESINRIYLYSNLTNTILTTLEFIDPAKGKILGRADQEISYKTGYDPAVYNRGTNSAVSLNDNIFWSTMQVGQVWWNLSKLSYIDYEQDTLTYRSINWGKLFPGSTVEVLEWVESTHLPSAYVANGGDGVPKYADNSAYVELVYVDPVTNIISIKYFYWVKNKTTVDPNNETRHLPIVAVQDIIENPKNQGVPYAAIVQNNAFVVYNVGDYLSAQNTILHLDYNTVKNTNIIHSEYELVQKGNADSKISPKIINKLIDSLAGIDILGAVVPDPTLSLADRFGLGTRPRQSMFSDRLPALSNLVDYVNSVLITKPIAREYDLSNLGAAESQPNIKLGEYDQKVATETELAYLDVITLAPGYKVLVDQDTTQDNLWVVYELMSDKTWEISRVQSYKTNMYWKYVDWYASGYSLADQIEFVVDTLVDALKLAVAPGNEILVRVSNAGEHGWSLITVNADLSFSVVGIQNGTVQLDTSIGNFADNELGFGNQGFSTNRFDQNPNIEIRYILTALKEDIFVGELDAEFNKLFFVMVNYLFNEQKYVDWVFKTSFISVTHKLRSLLQYPNYIKDNQTYYQDYITEVKPYSTKIREYSINYDSIDTFGGDVTDFDLPGYYDTTSKVFRSPSGEQVAKDEALWQTQPYNQWYANRNHRVESIVVENGGTGYTAEPIVTIVGGGTAASGATARAIIDYDLGTVIRIDVIKNGSGYYTTPTVIINGSNTTPATAYAMLKNNQVRTFDTTLKFDRISYTSTVQEWTANASYTAGDIITHTTDDGIRSAYTVNTSGPVGATFISNDYTVYDAANFNNANDRITGYYQPGASMPARDLKQLLRGIDYPGVQVQGLGFDQAPGFGSGSPFDSGMFDNIQYDTDGLPMISDDAVDTIIRSNYTDLALGTRAEDIDVIGGAYIDAYSSHAPEEMVPGIVFDTLDMQVYTKINGNVDVVGYRMFSNMMRDESYLRIADAHSTLLSEDLAIDDTVIYVYDATVLSTPDIPAAMPGVVFINGERITYYTIDIATGALGQIRRGTQGTSTPALHTAESLVVDASESQLVPNATPASWDGVSYLSFDPYTVTDVVSYYLDLSGSITANVGDIISQTVLGANVTISSISTSTNVVLVTMNAPNPFRYLENDVQLSGNVTVVTGDIITQVSTGANLYVTLDSENINTIAVSYNSMAKLAIGSGNIAINGVDAGVYPTTITTNPATNSAILVNGTSTGNVYPMSITVAGLVDIAGNVSIAVEEYLPLITANVWYNIGATTATDGNGFDGATTPQVTFIKNSTANTIASYIAP